MPSSLCSPHTPVAGAGHLVSPPSALLAPLDTAPLQRPLQHPRVFPLQTPACLRICWVSVTLTGAPPRTPWGSGRVHMSWTAASGLHPSLGSRRLPRLRPASVCVSGAPAFRAVPSPTAAVPGGQGLRLLPLHGRCGDIGQESCVGSGCPAGRSLEGGPLSRRIPMQGAVADLPPSPPHAQTLGWGLLPQRTHSGEASGGAVKSHVRGLQGKVLPASPASVEPPSLLSLAGLSPSPLSPVFPELVFCVTVRVTPGQVGARAAGPGEKAPPQGLPPNPEAWTGSEAEEGTSALLPVPGPAD